MGFIEKRISIHESELGRKRTHTLNENPDRSCKPQRKAFFNAHSVNFVEDNAFSIARNFKSNTAKNEHQNFIGVKCAYATECLFCSKPGHLLYSS